MSTYTWAVVALGVSLLPLILIALRDPKRLRSLRDRRAPSSSSARRAMSAVTLMPGLALCVIGEWPAFLIWLGGVTAGGWIFVMWLARSAVPGPQ
ncbi:MAG: hypothetical protein M3O62_00985 [Pseudomonadota bacterium]|nr:hypothetical protein [Pseudomonadota bacterium]